MKTTTDFFSPRLVSALACITLLGLLGCSGDAPEQKPTAEVHGKVTFNGKPLKSGEIIFFPDSEERTASGKIQADGSYKLRTYAEDDGALLGSHKVTVVSEFDESSVSPEDFDEGGEPPSLPVKYSLQKKSGLKAEVKEGGNEFNFNLKD